MDAQIYPVASKGHVFGPRVNWKYSGSKVVENTFPMSPYKILLNDSNGHGCYFKKYELSNMWIIHIQSPTNLPKCMWKLVFNVVDVIFWFGSLKRKTHKVQRNNAPSKTFKNILLGQKLQLIRTYENMVKF